MTSFFFNKGYKRRQFHDTSPNHRVFKTCSLAISHCAPQLAAVASKTQLIKDVPRHCLSRQFHDEELFMVQQRERERASQWQADGNA